jgi:phage-related protein
MYTIACAMLKDGCCPGKDFFDELPPRDQAKLMNLFSRLAEHGKITNPEKFGDLKEGFREFKSHQIRMRCRFTPGRLVVVTHGFVKKKDKAPKEEIARAKRIFQEDQERAAKTVGNPTFD